jgi:LysR family glycine cleavage system transcriptional activator
MTETRSAWLSALGAFESAARHQNFAHAAQELHLTASAVSHHVRKLEAHLGVALFQRHARGVTLTAEGRLLADATGNALADIDAVFAAVRPSARRTRVRVATLHSFAHSWLIPRLTGFAARHPDIGVTLETEIGLARFDDAGPDLGIRHGMGHWPGLSAQRLMDEQMFPVAAPHAPFVRQVSEPSDIARLPLISDLTRQGWPDWFRAAGVRRVRLAQRYAVSDSTDALAIAAAGLGAALARTRIVAPWIESGRLAPLPGPIVPARYSYYLIHPAHRRLSPAADAFARWLLDEVRGETLAQPPAGAPRAAA